MAQPIRLGKYGAGATEADKATRDAGGQQHRRGHGGDHPGIDDDRADQRPERRRCLGALQGTRRLLDQQVSKAVLGQTATTDAVTGGLGSGKEHRQVQEDIERADAKALAAVLNRDLVMPWVKLNHGPQKRYPRLKIERPEQEDLSAFATAIGPMIDRGLEWRKRTCWRNSTFPNRSPAHG